MATRLTWTSLAPEAIGGRILDGDDCPVAGRELLDAQVQAVADLRAHAGGQVGTGGDVEPAVSFSRIRWKGAWPMRSGREEVVEARVCALAP